MFGLDARIALAIFGALSVISGAALYSAIQNAQATAVLTTAQEIGKAWEAFYLDTGSDLKQQSTSSTGIHHRYTKELKESTKAGWQGPYLSYEENGTSGVLKHSDYGNVHLLSTKDTEWGGDTNWYPGEVCADKTDCYVWVHLTEIGAERCANVDTLVDGSNSPKTGNLRCRDSGELYFKYAPLGLPPVN